MVDQNVINDVQHGSCSSPPAKFSSHPALTHLPVIFKHEPKDLDQLVQVFDESWNETQQDGSPEARLSTTDEHVYNELVKAATHIESRAPRPLPDRPYCSHSVYTGEKRY